MQNLCVRSQIIQQMFEAAKPFREFSSAAPTKTPKTVEKSVPAVGFS